jgi:hypothetical protein
MGRRAKSLGSPILIVSTIKVMFLSQVLLKFREFIHNVYVKDSTCIQHCHGDLS